MTSLPSHSIVRIKTDSQLSSVLSLLLSPVILRISLFFPWIWKSSTNPHSKLYTCHKGEKLNHSVPLGRVINLHLSSQLEAVAWVHRSLSLPASLSMMAESCNKCCQYLSQYSTGVQDAEIQGYSGQWCHHHLNHLQVLLFLNLCMLGNSPTEVYH